MDKCLLHEEEAKRTCVKCKKRFCEKCAALTEYSGLCPECERDKQRRIYDYALKKKTTYLSNALAFLIGALAFLAAGFIFTDFKTAGMVGLCVLGALSLVFFVLFADKCVACRRASALADAIDAEIKKNKNRC